MALVYCPECGAKVSDKATFCPSCGYQVRNEEGLVPFSALAKTPRYTELRIPEADLFGTGGSLISASVRGELGSFLADANQMAKLAPNIYQGIEEAMKEQGTVWAADFSKAAEKMMDSGELVLGVEKKTGDFLPQLRDAKTGRVYEYARLHQEQLPTDMAASMASFNMQMTMAEVLVEIKDVAAKVEGLRLEVEGDRIGRAKGVWLSLEQASRIHDARLRERQILGIAASATEQRAVMQENFEVQVCLAGSKKGKGSNRSDAASSAINDLTVIVLMARTEYAAYALIDEPDAAKAALSQLDQFIKNNGLDDRQTLLRINSRASKNMEEVTTSFFGIAQNVSRLELQEGQGFEKPSLPEEGD